MIHFISGFVAGDMATTVALLFFLGLFSEARKYTKISAVPPRDHLAHSFQDDQSRSSPCVAKKLFELTPYKHEIPNEITRLTLRYGERP